MAFKPAKTNILVCITLGIVAVEKRKKELAEECNVLEIPSIIHPARLLRMLH